MKIIWDKGHGGNDPGAVANGLQEKQLTHKIVEYAMSYLEENYTGFEQRTTRTGDQTLTLSQRAKMANDWGADVFISVHINAGKGTGFETYVYNGGVSSRTVALQNVLHNEILTTMRQFGNITDRGKKRANYAVLRETKMPAVLTENLFIDSNDAKHLQNEAFLKAVGEAHARGVAKFLGLREKPKVQSQQKPSDEKLYHVQVGAFRDRKNAERLAEDLQKKGYPTIIV
ncbi:N-acetylmuramoyl-L-alanine amidase [Anoxybacillus sp. ST4]|uniref:N-acetylmuramoyl-L-alanine amidase n=1 Tax=Anoxybacillus sp. ST4 TaxID=2864181 RepID=UPI001C643B9E|nr:N-acetylmuramoyl-L-alanine amidase [Anoxybacillus sp. ST4]MBW7652034.1 N-acetylmuramoyl-L-alanine amidase [Anoxybacillus sp. ST4]